MTRCSALITCSLLLVSLIPAVARAERECNGRKPWVLLTARTSAPLAAAVRSDLWAGLAPNNIQVCPDASGPGSPPLARVVVEQTDAAGAEFRLEVTDSVTRKRVERDLSLDQLPADGRSLALAVAAEELLRASWAELALRGVHSAETAAPPEVQAVVARAEPPPAAPSRFVALGARVSFESFTAGQTHYGGDLFGVVPLGRVAGVFMGIGARRGLSVQAPHGSIASSGFGGEAGLSLDFLRKDSLDVGAFVSGRLLRLRFEPQAEPDATRQASSGLVLTSRLGLSLAFGKRGVLRSYTSLGAGLPLRSFAAADTGEVVTGASELELFASIGLALELP